MSSSRACLVLRACASVFAASVGLAVPSIAAGAASEPATTTVSVTSSGVWTDTGLTVVAGELVDIRAVGRIHFGGSPIDQLAPAGIARAGGCSGIAKQVSQWPAPALACWSLIGKIGNAQPFEIGAARAFRATLSGELSLGVNDDYLLDNRGAWSAEVRVTPAPSASGSKDDSSSLKKIAIAGAGLAALIALLTLGLLAARRRAAARRSAEAQPTETELRELAAMVAGRASGDILPEPRGHAPAATVSTPTPTPTPTIVAPKGDPTDVNIFEVEFSDFASLRVGYSYFPEGTTVRWLVRQGATTAATGAFVTSGGGGTNHYVTIVLGTELQLRAEAADVDFTWDIGGVPFGYSVRRDPGP